MKLFTHARRVLEPRFADLEACLEKQSGSVLLGVSGGGDSRLLMEVAARSPLRASHVFHVVCVDHGTGAWAAREARRVCARAAVLGFPAHRAPASCAGADEASLRAGRFQAFHEVAGRVGARCVVLGHHADDVVEGWCMAIQGRGGGRHGAAAPVHATHGQLSVVRPFVRVPRKTLRAGLSALGLAAVARDPADARGENARAEVRQVLRARDVHAGYGLGRRMLLAAERQREDEAVLTAEISSEPQALDSARARRALLALARAGGVRLRSERIEAMLAASSGTWRVAGVRVRKDGDRWVALPVRAN